MTTESKEEFKYQEENNALSNIGMTLVICSSKAVLMGCLLPLCHHFQPLIKAQRFFQWQAPHRRAPSSSKRIVSSTVSPSSKHTDSKTASKLSKPNDSPTARPAPVKPQ